MTHANLKDGITTGQTAVLVGLSYSTFTAALPTMIEDDGFPAPFIDAAKGRTRHRRFSRRAVRAWIDRKSAPSPDARMAQDRDTILERLATMAGQI